MTNANEPPQADEDSAAQPGDAQSLTDLIDQLDRASFRRTFANRDTPVADAEAMAVPAPAQRRISRYR